MQTSRGILKKKITRKVTLLEIVPRCSLISLAWCWAVSLEESFLKSCTSKLGIIKNSGNSALKNDVNSVTIRSAVGVQNPESTEPNLFSLASIFSSSLLLISTDLCGRASPTVAKDPALWNKLTWVIHYSRVLILYRLKRWQWSDRWSLPRLGYRGLWSPR